MRARPPAQRKGTRSQKVAGNVGGGERFDLIIAGEGKSECVAAFPRGFVSAGDWESGLVVECAAA